VAGLSTLDAGGAQHDEEIRERDARLTFHVGTRDDHPDTQQEAYEERPD
jgi:hypothetical protein